MAIKANRKYIYRAKAEEEQGDLGVDGGLLKGGGGELNVEGELQHRQESHQDKKDRENLP